MPLIEGEMTSSDLCGAWGERKGAGARCSAVFIFTSPVWELKIEFFSYIKHFLFWRLSPWAPAQINSPIAPHNDSFKHTKLACACVCLYVFKWEHIGVAVHFLSQSTCWCVYWWREFSSLMLLPVHLRSEWTQVLPQEQEESPAPHFKASSGPML